jgi:hypothetical protein
MFFCRNCNFEENTRTTGFLRGLGAVRLGVGTHVHLVFFTFRIKKETWEKNEKNVFLRNATDIEMALMIFGRSGPSLSRPSKRQTPPGFWKKSILWMTLTLDRIDKTVTFLDNFLLSLRNVAFEGSRFSWDLKMGEIKWKKCVLLSSWKKKLKTGRPFRKTTFFGEKNVWNSCFSYTEGAAHVAILEQNREIGRHMAATVRLA